MPTFMTAKTIAENALRTIGAFPASQSQADAGELRITLMWLEMTLNNQAGVRTMPGFWKIIDIPLEANVGDYDIADYTDAATAQHIFSVNLVDSVGRVQPLDIQYENDAVTENLTNTGDPCRATITKDAKNPRIKLYPMPVQANQDAGQIMRIRLQSYHTPINSHGNGGEALLLRPTWYLWITKRLAYEIGCGPVRRLDESELSRLTNDANILEIQLSSRDGQYESGKPPVTEPMDYDCQTTNGHDYSYVGRRYR
jgi:hypothetical protein